MSRQLEALLLALALAPVACTGCSTGGGRQEGVADPFAGLKDIFNAYGTYYRAHQKSPTKAADLTAKNMDVGSPTINNAIKSGKYVIVWGLPLQGKGTGDPETVLAYEKDAAAAGGKVIMANGDFKTLTAAELSAKIKK